MEKRLTLWQDFGLNGIIYKEQDISGFSLTIDDDFGGFSWEWFTAGDCSCEKPEEHLDKESNVFKKLQGSGAINIHLNNHSDWDEIIAYEFLDDVTMRGYFGFFGALGGETHHIVIKKGSVFAVGQSMEAKSGLDKPRVTLR